MSESVYIFGYGSLVHKPRLKKYLGRESFGDDDVLYCRLKGFRRTWNVAMDNRVDIPGYKYYIDKETGLRSDIFVTFLNIRPSLDTSIFGILFRVDIGQLAQLDSRERNYKRADITDSLDISINGRAWVYIGLPESENRFKLGISAQTSVIDRNYFDLVFEAYSFLGKDVAKDYIATTDKPTIPLLNLKRIDLPIEANEKSD